MELEEFGVDVGEFGGDFSWGEIVDFFGSYDVFFLGMVVV